MNPNTTNTHKKLKSVSLSIKLFLINNNRYIENTISIMEDI